MEDKIINSTKNQNSGFKKSIWKQVTEGDWRLFYDYSNDGDKQLPSNPNNEQPIKLIDHNNKKILGSTVMTPNGLGRLIKHEHNIYTVKILKSNSDHMFEDSFIMNTFPILIRILEKDQSKWIKLMIPANGNVDNIKRLLIDYKILEEDTSFYLIFNGTELKEGMFFDQLDLKPESQILLCGLKTSMCKVSRFTTINTWWYTYQSDGITFTTNKTIKLSGLGFYRSHENKTQNGKLIIFLGTVSSGINLVDEVVEIPPSASQEECITPITFKKAIIIKANIEYTIQFTCTNYCYFYYGSNGKKTVVGEKKVEFNFKLTPGSSNGSAPESGNFPEFYYYC